MLFVDAVGHRKIEAAVLGLRAPVGLVADLVERLRRNARARHRNERGAAKKSKGLTAIDAVFRHAHGSSLSRERAQKGGGPKASQATDMPHLGRLVTGWHGGRAQRESS